LGGKTIYTLAIDPSNPAIIYAGTTSDGPYKSVDGGTSWTPANQGLHSLINALVIDPSQPATLFAAALSGTYRTQDAGPHWSLVGPFGQTDGVVVDPTNSAIVYAASNSPNPLHKSLDGGATWSEAEQGITDTYLTDLAIDPSNPAVLYTTSAYGHTFAT